MRSCDGGVTIANGHRRPRHTFQVLTKRPERMAELANSRALGYDPDNPPDNIWLGTSIENRRFVHRADYLRETPAAVRFISAEPLLGPLTPDGPMVDPYDHEEYPDGDFPISAVHTWADGYQGASLNLEEIDWLIAGGESGLGHRPMNPDWVRGLRDYCQEWPWQGEREGVTAFFFKQWGGRTPKAGGRELDGRTWDEFPLREAA
jgi:protein gp37